jgi:hypothetical protein
LIAAWTSEPPLSGIHLDQQPLSVAQSSSRWQASVSQGQMQIRVAAWFVQPDSLFQQKYSIAAAKSVLCAI